MACNYNIKVVEGNEFALLLPLKKRTYVASTPIDEDIVYSDLRECVVKIGGVVYAHTIVDGGVQVIVPATLAKGTYNIELTAVYHGSDIRAAYFDGLTIVEYNEQSDAQQYIAGSPIVAHAAFVIGGTLTDAELEALKAEYRQAIEAAEQAEAEAEAEKEEYAEKIEELDDVASETTLNAVNDKIGQYGDTGRNPSVFGVLHEIWEQINAEDGHVVDMLHGVMNSLIAPDAIFVNNVKYKFNAAGGHVTTTDYNYTAWVSSQNNTIYLRNDDVVHVGSIAYAQPDFSAAVVGTVTSVVTATKSQILEAIDSMADGYTLGSIVTILNGLWGDNQSQASISSILAAISALVIPTVQEIQNGLATSGNVTTAQGNILGSDGTSADNTTLKSLLNTINTNMYKGVPINTIATSSATIQPNTWNIWSSAQDASFTITQGAAVSGVLNEWIIRFSLGSSWDSTQHQITFTGNGGTGDWGTLQWNGGSVPSWTASKTYEINIVNGIAMWAEV